MRAHGINANQGLVQNGGTINANGTTGISAFGVHVALGNLTQTGGTIISTGGSGAGSHGIQVSTPAASLTQQGTGSIIATGGSGINVYGMQTDMLIQNGSTFSSTGGNANNAYGTSITTSANQTNGTINATGGTQQNSYGIFLQNNNLEQAGNGTINATGGTALDAYGINITAGHLIQNTTSATVAVQAGSGANAHGMFVNEAASLSGNLHLKPTVNLHSTAPGSTLFINNTANAATAVTFNAGSNIRLTIDGNTQKSGLAQVNQGNTVITPGAAAQIEHIDNIHNLTLGQEYSSLFLEHLDPASAINGTFTLDNANLTTTVHLEKRGNDYYIVYTRDAELVTVLNPELFPNEKSLIGSFSYLTRLATPESATLRQYADMFENSASRTEAQNTAHILQRNLTPHAFTRVPRLAVQNSSFVRNAIYTNLETPRYIKFKGNDEISFTNNTPSFMGTAFNSNQGYALQPPSAQAPSTAFVTKPTLSSVIDTFSDNDFTDYRQAYPCSSKILLPTILAQILPCILMQIQAGVCG